MNRADRAKQFLPFDALKGLHEELAKREERHNRVEKVELSEDKQLEIAHVLERLEPNFRVEVVFYYKGHYLDIVGDIVKVNPYSKFILMGQQKIFFSDIKDITILDY